MSLNLVAVVVFVFTLTSLLGPLVQISPTIPAIATAGLLGLAAIDTFGWQGQGATVLLDWLARFSPAHRDRILHHEAGHFLVAHQLGIPVTGYSLSAWQALRQGQRGLGGVRFDTSALEADLQQGKVSAQTVDRYCTIWMAGSAAEYLKYGEVQGGTDDRAALRTLLTRIGVPPAQADQKERWAALQAKTLLQTHQDAYEALAAAMAENASIEECLQHLPATAK
jgi:hypothetical protein